MNKKTDEFKFSNLDTADSFYPRTIQSNYTPAKTMEKFAGTYNDLVSSNIGQLRQSMNIHQNPSRRWYDPTMSNTSLLLPKSLKQKNKWYRWFYDHDELTGAILDVHAELPYSPFELELDDPFILRQYLDSVESMQLETKLPAFDLEYMKIGEVIPQAIWDDSKGYWTHVVALNPDYVELTYSPFVEDGYSVELIPDDDLRSLINSTRIEDQELKKKLPKDIVNRVLTGRNITLNNEEVTHIARRSNPYDTRGTSIISRILRLLMYEDKLREAQLTIADNFIYPLKLFLLGDSQRGWIPNAEHQNALAQMLQQANFDPNFSLIYHYGLDVKYITVADKVMNVTKEYEEINKKKMAALGVPATFFSGESSFASANVGLQTQLARYKAKRDLFEHQFIRKLFKIMAKRNEWYLSNKNEVAFNFRIKRTAAENADRLMLPDILWHKKLNLRDDQSYLTFLNNIYNSGKGPVSVITLLRSMGLDASEELKRKRKGRELENRIGEKLTTAAPAAGAGSPAGAPGGVTAAIKGLFKFGKKDDSFILDNTSIENSDLLVKASDEESEVYYSTDLIKEFSSNNSDLQAIMSSYKPVSDTEWLGNLKSPRVSSDIVLAFANLHDCLSSMQKKYQSFNIIDKIDSDAILSCYRNLYILGKNHAKSLFNKDLVMATEDDLIDYSDIVLINEFADWIHGLTKVSNVDSYTKLLRSFGNSSFAYGQLKCFSEYGIKSVKLSNVMINKGLSFDIDSLLRYRCGMSCIISPKDEIPMFLPRIEHMYYNKYEDTTKIFAEPSELYKNMVINGVSVKNCPIEYAPDLSLILSSMGKDISKIANSIEFTHDITSTQEWNKDMLNRFSEENKSVPSEERAFLVNTLVQAEKLSKSGTANIYRSGKTLFINNAIDASNNRFIASFLSGIDIISNEMNKNIKKYESKLSYDLSKQEIDFLLAKNHIMPVSDEAGVVQYYKVSSLSSSDIDNKLKVAKMWDAAGKSVGADKISIYDMFIQNLPMFVEFPHKMDSSLKEMYSEIIGE